MELHVDFSDNTEMSTDKMEVPVEDKGEIVSRRSEANTGFLGSKSVLE